MGISKNQSIDLTDDELMNLIGGSYTDISIDNTITPPTDIIPKPIYILKYGIQPLYGIWPSTELQ